MKEQNEFGWDFEALLKQKDEEIIELVTVLVKHQFPDIKNLEVSLNQVKYDDDRYSLEEVSEFVKTLYKP